MDLSPPDYTLFIQLVIFLASFVVLKFMVWDPYVKLIHLRHSKTAGLKEQAEKAKSEAAKMQSDYETLMKAERKRITQSAEEERKRIENDEKEIISGARDEVAKQLDTVRSKIKADTDAARKELEPLVNDFSSRIVSKLVGYSVTVPSGFSKGTNENKKEQTAQT